MIPLSTSTFCEEERMAVLEVMDSGRFTMGDRVAEFEKAYADYCGTKYCVAVNSGSSANLLMTAAFSLRNPKVRRVIVPTIGWSTSYSPFGQYGYKMVFVDVDRETLNYDVEQLRGASDIEENTVILAINLLGNPNEYGSFPNVPILEDNCESMGAEYKGKRTGSFGVMASHSTFFSHHICTMEGGMVTTDDEYYYHLMLALRSHGWTRHLPKDNALGATVASWHFIVPGYNVRPTEMQAALGLVQLRKLDGFIKQRRDNAARFPLSTQKEIGRSSWFGFAVFGSDRECISEFETRPIVSGNFLRQPVMKHYDFAVYGDSNNADWVHKNGLMIGNSHHVIDWSVLRRAA